jgi:hypothetical protein
MSYNALVQVIKSQTKVELACQHDIHVNGELGSPCSDWQVAFVGKCPYVLKPLDKSEQPRIADLQSIHFASPHVVEFLIFDISVIRGQTKFGSPPIKQKPVPVDTAFIPTLMMLMPILPITVEQMPSSAFSKHVAVFRPEHDFWMLATSLYDRLHDVPVVGSGTGDFLEVDQVLSFLKACLPE